MVSDGAGFHRPGIVSQANLVGRAYVKAPTALQLPVLSFGVLGAQAVWSIDMAFAPPYLLDLGLSKSAMAAVFVAGPLSGLIVQPLIGQSATRYHVPFCPCMLTPALCHDRGPCRQEHLQVRSPSAIHRGVGAHLYRCNHSFGLYPPIRLNLYRSRWLSTWEAVHSASCNCRLCCRLFSQCQ